MTESHNTFNKQIVNAETIGAEQSAHWIIKGLTATYGVHNLTASVEKTTADIINGRLRPFFMIERDEPVSCAALIIGEKTVEIGRAVNMPKGHGGGELMRHVIKTWEDDKLEWRPLVAEVRMAAPFEGIAGGQGSQASLLPEHKVGMIPHAFLPTFHHPGPNGPDRQELFCFSTKQIFPNAVFPDRIVLPKREEMNIELIRTLMAVNGYRTQVATETCRKGDIRLIQHAAVPFNVFTIDPAGQPIETVTPNNNALNPFDLTVVDAFDPELNTIAQSLIEQGFIGAGISAPHEGSLKLLFGRLGKCTLAPTQPMRGFPLVDAADILQVDALFRQQSHESQ